MQIPYEIINEIMSYNTLYVNRPIFLSNKFFNKLYSEEYLKNVIFIQKIYRKYKLPEIFLYLNTFFSLQSVDKMAKYI